MLAYVHAPRDDVRAVLEGTEGMSLGPMSATGWTAAWVPEAEAVQLFDRAILVDIDAGDEQVSLEVRHEGRRETWEWEVAEEESSDAPAPESQAWARSAASRVSQVLGASESETPLTAVIARQPSADELVDELSAIGGLPVATTTPVRALVVARVAPKGLRLAGALAAAGLGPVALADLGAGCAALQLEDAPERSDLLADFVGETLLGRGARGWGKRVLVLWRDAIGAAGFRVYRGSSMVADGEWGTGVGAPRRRPLVGP